MAKLRCLDQHNIDFYRREDKTIKYTYFINDAQVVNYINIGVMNNCFYSQSCAISVKTEIKKIMLN
jgi:hypothetical protein